MMNCVHWKNRVELFFSGKQKTFTLRKSFEEREAEKEDNNEEKQEVDGREMENRYLWTRAKLSGL